MKRLFLLITVPCLLFACSKTEMGHADDSALMKSSDAVTNFVVGIMPSQNGDAKVNNMDMVTVPSGTTVTITAYPVNDNYVIDHWVQTNSQSAASGQNVHWYENSFTFKVTGETWFKPVFRYAPLQQTVQVRIDTYVNNPPFISASRIEYIDERGISRTDDIPLPGSISKYYNIAQGSDIMVYFVYSVNGGDGEMLYCLWKDETGNIHDGSSANPIYEFHNVYQIYSDIRLQVAADTYDFREDFQFPE